MFFIDGLKVSQEHSFDLPFISQTFAVQYDSLTGEALHTRQQPVKHEGSHSTLVTIRVSGRTVTVEGNPSKINRLDNLYGYATLEECINVYNQILASYGLPGFTKNNRVFTVPSGKAGDTMTLVGDGAVIKELHITTNMEVGEGNVRQYIKGMSTQKYRNMSPHLFTNGCSVHWLNSKGKRSRTIYATIYDKAAEIQVHTLPKVIRQYGEQSEEANYVRKVMEHCKKEGIVRYEQKIRYEMLKKLGWTLYGKESMDDMKNIQKEFLQINEKIKVDSMKFETIVDKLISEGFTTRQSNTTALYAIKWSIGEVFDLNKSQVKVNRARLRKIGIDISLPCDINRFTFVTASPLVAIMPLISTVPQWYNIPTQEKIYAN